MHLLSFDGFKEKIFPSPTAQEQFVFEVLGRYINNVKFQDKISIQSEGGVVINQMTHT